MLKQEFNNTAARVAKVSRALKAVTQQNGILRLMKDRTKDEKQIIGKLIRRSLAPAICHTLLKIVSNK